MDTSDIIQLQPQAALMHTQFPDLRMNEMA